MRSACRDSNTSRPSTDITRDGPMSRDRSSGMFRTAASAETMLTNPSFNTLDESKIYCLIIHCLIITFMSIEFFSQMTKMLIFNYYMIIGSDVDFCRKKIRCYAVTFNSK